MLLVSKSVYRGSCRDTRTNRDTPNSTESRFVTVTVNGIPKVSSQRLVQPGRPGAVTTLGTTNLHCHVTARNRQTPSEITSRKQ
eukprot:3937405-Rhodomonas_salina.1